MATATRICRGCGVTITYNGRGRPRTRCEQCAPGVTTLRPRRQPVRCAPIRCATETDRLERDNLWLLYRIASHWTSRSGVEVNELANEGYVGLRQAARRFDPSAGAKFTTYASYRIDGAIRDYLRRIDWVHRDDRQQIAKLVAARHRFVRREGHYPQHAELAAELGWTPEALDRLQIRLNRANVMSLEAPLRLQQEDDVPLTLVDVLADRRVDIEGDACVDCSRDQVRGLLGRLRPREQSVIGWYFWEDMTLREIAPLLGVTESRVSQILTAALKRLRELAPDLQEVA